eukprot:Pgem_evm1s11053
MGKKQEKSSSYSIGDVKLDIRSKTLEEVLRDFINIKSNNNESNYNCDNTYIKNGNSNIGKGKGNGKSK